MRLLKKTTLMLLLLVIAVAGFAQEKPDSYRVEMADTMRSNGRIYVVVAVVVTILTGLILYMIRVDRKISRIEKDNRQ